MDTTAFWTAGIAAVAFAITLLTFLAYIVLPVREPGQRGSRGDPLEVIREILYHVIWISLSLGFFFGFLYVLEKNMQGY